MRKSACVLVLTLLIGCSEKDSTRSLPVNAENSSSTCPSVSVTGSETLIPIGDPSKVVAELNGTPITEAELYNNISSQLARIQIQMFETKKAGINQLIEERLLNKEAERQGLTIQEVLKKEVDDKVGEISEKEIADFYQSNANYFSNKTLDQARDFIRQQIIARKASFYQRNLFDRLRENAKINILLESPRAQVSEGNNPKIGGKDAKVVIIEFTDYQCPFCARARPVVKQILKEYGDQIRYVVRDFPLEFHPQANKAAEAAHCADTQGKFWEYTDLLWANHESLEISNLKRYAAQLKLDTQKFDQCLDSGQFASEVQRDMEEGTNAGVSGTPSFFINGQLITGARSVVELKEIIDAELKRDHARS